MGGDTVDYDNSYNMDERLEHSLAFQGFIQDFEFGGGGGGGKQDGSRMIVACKKCACLLRGFKGHTPLEKS